MSGGQVCLVYWTHGGVEWGWRISSNFSITFCPSKFALKIIPFQLPWWCPPPVHSLCEKVFNPHYSSTFPKDIQTNIFILFPAIYICWSIALHRSSTHPLSDFLLQYYEICWYLVLVSDQGFGKEFMNEKKKLCVWNKS